jgi:hypothetical protein
VSNSLPRVITRAVTVLVGVNRYQTLCPPMQLDPPTSVAGLVVASLVSTVNRLATLVMTRAREIESFDGGAAFAAGAPRARASMVLAARAVARRKTVAPMTKPPASSGGAMLDAGPFSILPDRLMVNTR